MGVLGRYGIKWRTDNWWKAVKNKNKRSNNSVKQTRDTTPVRYIRSLIISGDKHLVSVD